MALSRPRPGFESRTGNIFFACEQAIKTLSIYIENERGLYCTSQFASTSDLVVPGCSMSSIFKRAWVRFPLCDCELRLVGCVVGVAMLSTKLEPTYDACTTLYCVRCSICKLIRMHHVYLHMYRGADRAAVWG